MSVKPMAPTANPNGHHDGAKPRPRHQWPAPWAGLIRRLLKLQPGRYVIVLHVEDGGPATWQIGAVGPDECGRQ